MDINFKNITTNKMNSSNTQTDEVKESTSSNSSTLSRTPSPSLPPSKKNNKYQNARQVLNSCETDYLPGREKEIQDLIIFLNEKHENQQSGSMYISGQPGTGKTACLQKLLGQIEFNQKFRQIYINCTSITSIGNIYKKIYQQLNLSTKSNNTITEKNSLIAIERYLTSSNNKKMLLLVLDEIDQLISKKQTILYTLFEWPSKFQSNIILIGIANSLDLIDRLSRLNRNSLLTPQLMHFQPYTKQQIIDIFQQRLIDGGVLDIFTIGTLQVLAAKISAISGDLRYALDIGRRVIELAEQHNEQQQQQNNRAQLNGLTFENELNEINITNNDNSENFEKIKFDQVLNVFNKIFGTTTQNLNNDLKNDVLPLQQKIVICAILLIENNEKNKDITIGRLHTIYARVCKNRGISSLDQSEFFNLCQLIETKGIFHIIKKNEIRLNRIQLQWDKDDITKILCDETLLSTILADKSCLRK